MKTQCPHCKSCYEVSDSYAGKRATCSVCKQKIVIHAYSPPKPKQKNAKSAVDINIVREGQTKDAKQLTAEDYERKIKLHKKREKKNKNERWVEWIIDFFLFRKMVYPYLIIIFFIFAFLFTLMYPVYDFMSSGFSSSKAPQAAFGRPPSVFTIFEHEWLFNWITLLLIRVFCEWQILFFKMYQDLRFVAGKMEKSEDKMLKVS